MPFLSQQDLLADVRKQADKLHRTRLRAALQTPGLTEAQRRDIQAQLAQIGHAKVYDGAAPAVPGAIRFEEPALPRIDPAMLQGMKRADLQGLAQQRGLDTKGTRTELIQRLLAAQS